MAKIGLLAFLAALLAAPAHQDVLRYGGDAKLVGFQPLPSLEGPMCEPEPTQFAALIPPQQAASRTTPAPAPADAIAKRPAAHIMRDPSAAFSGIAIDLKHNEVVMTDENNFAIMSYDRMENTPPNAKLSEPKRIIQGMEAYLEYNCSVYVDPETGDIYGINNDTLNWMTVFDRNARGNARPTRFY